MEQNVAKLMLENKIDIWNSPDLFQLVQEYFDNSLKTSNFYSVLGNCLKRARENQLTIQTALQHVTPEALQENSEAQYRKFQEELQNFKTAGCPLTDEFFGLFQAIYKGHVEMLEKLHAKRSKLHKKLKNVRAWRIFSGIIFVATFATVLICSVVAAAIAARLMVGAWAAATSIPIGSMGKWVDSLWTKYEDTIKGEREVINAMEAGTFEALRVPMESWKKASVLRSVEWCL